MPCGSALHTMLVAESGGKLNLSFARLVLSRWIIRISWWRLVVAPEYKQRARIRSLRVFAKAGLSSELLLGGSFWVWGR